jgi:hypothetical protein
MSCNRLAIASDRWSENGRSLPFLVRLEMRWIGLDGFQEGGAGDDAGGYGGVSGRFREALKQCRRPAPGTISNHGHQPQPDHLSVSDGQGGFRRRQRSQVRYTRRAQCSVRPDRLLGWRRQLSAKDASPHLEPGLTRICSRLLKPSAMPLATSMSGDAEVLLPIQQRQQKAHTNSPDPVDQK